jgi:hypothetical protein
MLVPAVSLYPRFTVTCTCLVMYCIIFTTANTVQVFEKSLSVTATVTVTNTTSLFVVKFSANKDVVFVCDDSNIFLKIKYNMR